MAKYAVHGGDFFAAIGVRLDHLENREQVVNADVLDAWYDPAPSVVQAVQQHLPWLIKTSPPTHAEGLVQVIAEARAVRPDQVLVGAGSSSLIFLLFPRLFAGKRVGILDPTYGEYAHVLEQVGAHVHRFDLAAPSFRPTVSELATFASGLDGLVLVNPNSPTGVGLPRAEMIDLLAGIPENVTVWVDETYIDFLSGAQSVEPLVAHHPNLVVSKSMSKFYALSGLRVGYVVANPALVDEAEAQTPPWSVGLIAQLAATEALRAADYYRAKAEETHALARELSEGLTNLGFEVTPPDANYGLAHLPGGGVARVVDRCADKGVFLRNCDSLSPRFQDDYLRVAVKSKADTLKILATIAAVR